MGSIPTFQETQIESRVGRRNFRQGREYFRNGAIYDARRRGATLKASCSGSGSMAYRLHVTFNQEDVIDGNCSCPVGRGGYCKHVAAMLLCWCKRPQEFVELEEIETALTRCSRRELVELVREVLELHPELEEVVEAKLPATSTRSPATPQTYRVQVAALLERATASDVLDCHRLAQQLTTIKEIGDAFSRQGEASSAAVVYLAIVCELLDQTGILTQHEPAISELVDQCVAGMGLCLADFREEGETRTIILRTLLHLFHFDLASFGSTRRDVAAIFVEQPTARERQLIGEWIEGMLSSVSSRTTRQGVGSLWLALVPDQLDHDSFCRICRVSGRGFDLVRRLISLGRTKQAVDEVRKAEVADLPRFADLLADNGQADVAQRIVAQRLEETGEPLLKEWLHKRQEFVENRRSVYELSERLFRLQPSFESYCRLRELGRQLDDWDDHHPRLLAWLEETDRYGLLMRVFLDENDVDRAVELLDVMETDWSGSPLVLEIARAAEVFRPDEARRLYLARVEHLIGAGGRPNYAEACRHLGRVRALMKRNGEARNWANCMEDIRHRHRGLAEFLEELGTAGL